MKNVNKTPAVERTVYRVWAQNLDTKLYSPISASFDSWSAARGWANHLDVPYTINGDPWSE